MDIDILNSIVKKLKFEDLQAELEGIRLRLESEDCPLILPLVGEFSSGKTSLINAITDSKSLETASAPTTAAIYEINFSASECRAVVTGTDGVRTEYDDISMVRNDIVSDSHVVQIYDTSAKVSSSIILVDTPGISSIDPRHRLSLVKFLPNADGIILVADIEQQVKKSLVDFVKEMNLDAKPLYLVLTKCDLKSPKSVEEAVCRITEDKYLPIRNVVCVSASTDDVSEFLNLLEHIQKNKASIIRSVNDLRAKAIADEALTRVNTLLDASSDEDSLACAIEDQKKKRKALDRAIESFIDEIEAQINIVKDKCRRTFEDYVRERLEIMVMSGKADYNREVVSIVNVSASSATNSYKEEIRPIITSAARSSLAREGITLCALEQIELTDYNIGPLPYIGDLGAVGHGNDKKIATAIKLAAAMAVAYAVGEAAETRPDVPAESSGLASQDIIMPAPMSTANKAYRFITRTQAEYSNVEGYNSSAGTQLGMHDGLVETAVGFATERLAGKPQRRKTIREYLDNVLLPKFRLEIDDLTKKILGQVLMVVQEAASTQMKEIADMLAEMQKTLRETHRDYASRVSTLKECQEELKRL